MKQRFVGKWILGISLLGAVTLGNAQTTGQSALILFSPQDAEKLRLSSEEEWPKTIRTRAIPTGPLIMIKSPEVKTTSTASIIKTSSPATFSVLFEQRRAPVDMKSLQIRAKKGIFSKSLTDLFLPHVHGTQLLAEGVAIPEGRFRVEIEIADVEGAKTVETYGLEVSKP